MTFTYDQLLTILQEASNSFAMEEELVTLHNNYCEECNYMDDYIYYNDTDELQMLFDNNVTEAMRAAYYGGWCYPDKFMKFNAYGNLESSDVPSHDWMCLKDIAQWLAEQDEDNQQELLVDFSNYLPEEE